MKVRFTGEDDPLALLNSKVYEVVSVEVGWYRIIDETGESYLYPPELFEIVQKLPLPHQIGDPHPRQPLTL